MEKLFFYFFYLSVYNGRSLRHNAVLDEPVLDLNAEKQVAKRIVGVQRTEQSVGIIVGDF